MNDQEIRVLHQQLSPIPPYIQQIFLMTGVAMGPEALDYTPHFNHETGEFVWGPSKDDLSWALGNVRPAEGANWLMSFGTPQPQNTEPVAAFMRSWPNTSDSTIYVEIDEEVTIEDGVQQVSLDENTWGSSKGTSSGKNWSVGGELETSLSSEVEAGASYMGASIKAKMAASVRAKVTGSGGGDSRSNSTEEQGGRKSSEDTTSKKTTTKRRVSVKFEVPPRTFFTASVMYDKATLVVPFTRVLPVDMSIRTRGFHIGGGPYRRYWKDFMGADFRCQSLSLREWFNGFFGQPPADCDDFQNGLDITFSREKVDTAVRDLLDKMRADIELMTIKQTGTVQYAEASVETYPTSSRPVRPEDKPSDETAAEQLKLAA